MRRTAPLNDRQLEVLKWVGDGCPPTDLANSFKRTASALQDRRLVEVSRSGGWSAELTYDGRYYLKNRRYPRVSGGSPAAVSGKRSRSENTRSSAKLSPLEQSMQSGEAPDEQPSGVEEAADRHRIDILERQLTNWRQARELRQFAWDLDDRIHRSEYDRIPLRRLEAARRWHDWVLRRADELDPITDLPGWPG